MNKRIKNKFVVGLVGAGSTGKEHLKYYQKKKEIDIIFLSEKNKKKKFNKKKIIFDSQLKLFKKATDNKIISISSYDNDHSNKIINHYKNSHVFVEKPLCKSFKELKKIHTVIKQNNYKNFLLSNLVLRTSKLFNKIMKRIRKGEFGEIFYFEGDYLYGRLPKLTKGWRGKDKTYSVVLGGGIHLIDLMLNFLSQQPISVYSSSNNIVTKKEKFNFPDFVQSTFCFPNGAVGKITANFGCVHKHQHIIKIYGTKKTFIYDDKGARLYDKRDYSLSKNILHEKELYKGKDCLLPLFFKRIKDKKNYFKDILKELNLINVCLFANKSLKIKKKIKIKYLKV